MEKPIIFVRMATINDIKYVNEIVAEMKFSAIERGSDITKCSSASIAEKMTEGKAIIVVTSTEEWVGFSYLAAWQDHRVVSNLGLIVSHKFRNSGVASAIKSRIFKLSRRQYLNAMVFRITPGIAILKMNTKLSFEPVTFDQITHNETFLEGCKIRTSYSILERKNRNNYLCKAMLFDPAKLVGQNAQSKVTEFKIA